MTIDEKLDLVIALLTDIQSRLTDVEDKQDELKDGISNLGLPGSGYSIFSTDDEE